MVTRNKISSVKDLFINRWSSRMFSETQLTQEELNSLFEAARWAPSCFNEQPWFFLLPRNDEEKETFFQLLLPGNQKWVGTASLLCYAIARRRFKHDDKLNRHYAFDAGAAWASLALQAQSMGLSAHAMAGYDGEAVYDRLKVDKEKHEVLAAIAIGRPTETARKEEERTERKPLTEVYGSID